MQDNHENRESWHLSKSINVGHLLTTILVVISAFAYINSFDKRLAESELKIIYLKESQQAQVARTDEKFKDIKSDLKDISKKLDRIIGSGGD